MVSENKLQDTCISSPSHFLTSGHLLWTPVNSNCFWFHLKAGVIGSWLYDGGKFNTTLLKYPLPIYAQIISSSSICTAKIKFKEKYKTQCSKHFEELFLSTLHSVTIIYLVIMYCFLRGSCHVYKT